MKNDFFNPEYDAAEQELLALLQKLEKNANTTKPTDEPTDVSAKAPQNPVLTEDIFAPEDDTEALPVSPDFDPTFNGDIPLILSFDEEEYAPNAKPVKKKKEEKAADEQPLEAADPTNELLSGPHIEEVPKKKHPFKKILHIFPRKGDAVRDIVLKCISLVSAVVLLVSLGFLLYFTTLEPQIISMKNEQFVSLYNDLKGNEQNKSAYDYPAGMQSSFRQLYDVNPDIAGWLSYVSTDTDKFININLPVVHCDNNEKYLHYAFDGTKLGSGTLFFDSSNVIAQGVDNKVSIIYGHNMRTGQMFAPLNKLYDSVYHARAAATISLNTLYEAQQYKVFAVLVCDEDAPAGREFGYLRNTFNNDSDFLNYVNELRARSLYDYPVDVRADDQLLILSTCTNKSQVKVSNGRMVVVARRIRSDEPSGVVTARIVENEDVIMPYAWYTLQNRTPHVFYTQADYHIPEDSIVTDATTATTTTATTTTATEQTAATTTAVKTTTAKAVTTTTTTTATTTATDDGDETVTTTTNTTVTTTPTSEP